MTVAAHGASAGTGSSGQTGDGTVVGIAYTDGDGIERSPCEWYSLDESGERGDGRGSLPQTQVFDGVVHVLFQRVCPDGSDLLVWVALVTGQDLLEALRDEVERQLPVPVPVYEPFDEQLGQTYVQVPIDFRTEPESWGEIVASAFVVGPPGYDPWVTITARPVELLFASGDPADPGLVAGCRGDAAVAPYVAAVPGACSYTFVNASSTVSAGTFSAEMAIVWEISYESSEGPGVLDMDPTIGPAPVRVGEIKALVNCTGPDPRQGAC